MTRTNLFRTRRALRFNTLEALEGKALLTASPGLSAITQVIPPPTLVSPSVPNPTTDATASNESASSSALETSGSSTNSAGDPPTTGSVNGGSNSGGSTESTGASGGSSSTSGGIYLSDSSGGQSNPPIDSASAALIKQANALKNQIRAADQAVANDKEAVGRLKGIMAADQADINGLFDQEATLTKQLNNLKGDVTADGQMVAAYLQGQLDALHEEEDALNQDLQLATVAYGNAQNQLLNDQIQDDQLNSALFDLRTQWNNTHLTAPCPF